MFIVRSKLSIIRRVFDVLNEPATLIGTPPRLLFTEFSDVSSFQSSPEIQKMKNIISSFSQLFHKTLIIMNTMEKFQDNVTNTSLNL
jgi:DNA-binding ferritin-like protein